VTKVEVEPPTQGDILQLAVTMRAADLLEIHTTGASSARDCLVRSVEGSAVCWAVRFNGKTAAIFGVRQLTPGTALTHPSGIVWALTGAMVDQHPMTFFRTSRDMLAILMSRFGLLANWVDARYSGALRWAEALGFTLDAPEPHGVNGALFRYVHIRGAHG